MQITFLGGVETVTGSKYLLTFNNKKILIDCGLYQGLKEFRLRNWRALPVHPAEIDAVILTHAHIDHSGYVPLLVKNGFRGKIFCTEGTKDLCAILLPDSGYLQEEDAKHANQCAYSKHHPAKPLYTREDALASLNYLVSLPFHEELALTPEFKFQFLPAGHIIGSAFIQIYYQNRTLLFTGDLGRPHDSVMQPPTLIAHADYLVVESTYGDHLHEPGHPKAYLKDIINRTVQRGGSVIIPAFAVGRAQALLHYIDLLKQEQAIPNVPLFLDSPMAIYATDILLKHRADLRLTDNECKRLSQVATYTTTPEESQTLDQDDAPKVIISASGMATGGRVLFHLMTYGTDPRNTILFTGYQAIGTRGARLIHGEKELKIHGQLVPIHAEVAQLSNTSAHSDYKETLAWLAHFERPPIRTFITHGEHEAASALKHKIEARFHWHCLVPHYTQKITL